MDMEYKILSQVYNGNWSNGYLLQDSFNNRVFRKLFRADARYDQVFREYLVAFSVWESGFSVPEPIDIGICNITKRYFIDFFYLDFRPFEESTKCAHLINQIISQIRNICPIAALNWKSYLDDQLKSFERYFEQLRGTSKEPILLKAKNKVMSVMPSVFVHGDFAPQNLAIIDNKLYFFDFQCSCVGPPLWDLSYLSACFPYDSHFVKSIAHDSINNIYWYVIFIASVRIGRMLYWRNVDSETEIRVNVLNTWINNIELLDVIPNISS